MIFVLGIVSLRQDSPDAADLAVSLAALKDWTFLLGPGFIVGWGNGVILGYLMYSSGLVHTMDGDAGTHRRLGIYAAVWGFRRDSPILSPAARMGTR